MGFSKIKGELTSRIGRPVRFGVPGDVAKVGGAPGHGLIIDEVWADHSVNRMPPRARESDNDWGDYSFCAQLIKWGDNDYTIRLAYYRRRPGEDHWEFASQTTINSYWPTIKALLERTLAKKHWFSDNPESPPE